MTENATPEYVTERIGEPANPYHAVLKALAESVEHTVDVPIDRSEYDPAPENTATPAEIAAHTGLKERYVKGALMREFILSGVVYSSPPNGGYVLKDRSTAKYDSVVDHYADWEFGLWERLKHRLNRWLFLRQARLVSGPRRE